MKKILSIIMFMVISVVCMAQINLKVNFGVKENTDSIYVENRLLNETNLKGSTSVAIEYEKCIKENVSLGLGLEYGYLNDPDNFPKTIYKSDKYTVTDSSTLTEVKTIPIYTYIKYEFYQGEKLDLYTKLYLGYAFNDLKDNPYRQITLYEKDKSSVLYKKEFDSSISNGIWYGVGVGMEYDYVFCELNYRFNRIDITIEGNKQDYNRDRLEFSAGFRF